MQPAVRQVRAMVIDDSPVFRQSLCSFLSDHEAVEVIGSANSAQEAFRLIEETTPDLVLIDLQMPGMNGLEATVLLRRRYPDLRVIMVTMYDTPELREASQDCGALGFVSKGRLRQDLPALLNEVLSVTENEQ
jgi:DNA-binding NarL/FixJ family response regulator